MFLFKSDSTFVSWGPSRGISELVEPVQTHIVYRMKGKQALRWQIAKSALIIKYFKRLHEVVRNCRGNAA